MPLTTSRSLSLRCRYTAEPAPRGEPHQCQLTFFASFRPILRSFFERRIRQRADIDDLIQEVFVRLAHRNDLASVSYAQGYLFQVAANVIRDRARHQHARHSDRHDSYHESVHTLEDFSPERVLIARQTVSRVARALEELPERIRVAFVLHRFEGLRYRQIAQRLGVSVSAVEKYIIQALAHVKSRTDD